MEGSDHPSLRIKLHTKQIDDRSYSDATSRSSLVLHFVPVVSVVHVIKFLALALATGTSTRLAILIIPCGVQPAITPHSCCLPSIPELAFFLPPLCLCPIVDEYVHHLILGVLLHLGMDGAESWTFGTPGTATCGHSQPPSCSISPCGLLVKRRVAGNCYNNNSCSHEIHILFLFFFT